MAGRENKKKRETSAQSNLLKHYEKMEMARTKAPVFLALCIARSLSLGQMVSQSQWSLPFRYRVIIVIVGIVTAQKDTTTTLRIVAVQNKFLITNPKNG